MQAAPSYREGKATRERNTEDPVLPFDMPESLASPAFVCSQRLDHAASFPLALPVISFATDLANAAGSLSFEPSSSSD